VKRESDFYLLLAWMTCGLLVLYVPIPPAGRVHGIDGLHIAVCILATRGLMQIVAWLPAPAAEADLPTDERKRWAQRGVLAVILIVSSLTNVFRMANEFVITSRHGPPPFMTRMMAIGLKKHQDGLGIAYSKTSGSPCFLPGELLATCHWLNTHTDLSDVVLAPAYVGTYIPYLAGNRVYYGHGYVTPEMWDRQKKAERFFSFQQTDSVRRGFLKSRQIDYVVFWSGNRTAVDDPDTTRFVESLEKTHPLELVYRNPRSLIFRTTFSPKETLKQASTTSVDAVDVIGRAAPLGTTAVTDWVSRCSELSAG
jgi:hypothetical protein